MKERHWTNDPELIERFVLHQVNPEERNELEDHLRICEVCKRAVRSEQLVLAGIRRSGRERFKSNLSKKLAVVPREEKKTPWVQMISAAAVIVILLTVGIYNRWFQTREEMPTADVVAQQSEEDKAYTPAEMKREQVPTERQRDEPTTQAPETQFAAKSPTQNEVRRVAQSPRAAVPAPTAMNEAEQLKRRADNLNTRDVANEAAGAAATQNEPMVASGVETIWVEGSILPLDSREVRAKAQVRDEAIAVYADKKADARAGRDEAVQADEKQGENSIVLSQQNSIALPASQQRVQQLNKLANARMNTTNSVMTKIERVGNQTHLTLFLDSLVDENELAKASIETPRSDSLIVNLPRQRIGYKLPTNANIDARQLKITK
jgi:hypothetical protein